MDGNGKSAEIVTNAGDGESKNEVKIMNGDGDGNNEPILDRKVMFPPPCSWYQPHVAAARQDMWGYVALSSLVVVKPVGPSQWPTFQLLETSPSKFTSISFCQSPWSELVVPNCPLVSGCENGVVRLWNIETSGVAQYHEAHKGHHVVVEWSPKNPHLIYSVDTQGCVGIWDLSQSSARVVHLGKIGPTCLAVSPFEDDIIALGSKGGHVQIVDTTGTAKIISKMRHDEEVFSVSWKPKGIWDAFSGNKLLSSSDFKEPFLVSSVSTLKPATIRVWDRNGKDIVILRPLEKETKDKKVLSKNFLPALWVRDESGSNDVAEEGDEATRVQLVSCGRLGEIISWTDSMTVSDELHALHSNYTIFSVIQCGDVLWSLSYEPVIVGWNIKHNHVEVIIPTFKGVCSIQASPIDHSRVALGGMDASIRIIGMESKYPEIAPSKLPTVTSRLKGRVTAIAWHPTKENRLAFGTDEGVLGIYDWKPDNKFAMTFDRRVSRTVYTLDWGPSTYAEDFVPKIWNDDKEKTSEPAEGATDSQNDKYDKLMLYACGGQVVNMIHPKRQSNALLNVSHIISKTNFSGSESKPSNRISDVSTDIKWSPDYSYLAVGYNDGRIELYSPPHLKLRCWIKCHGRGIQFLAWRPFDFNPLTSNPNSFWFASASNDGTARLFNLKHLFSPEFKENPNSEVHQVISSVSTLNGHGGLRVISLAWSRHNPDLIVTVSYDRTAIVWNASTGEKVARYTGHLHRLVACMFHPSDPFKLITTSDEMATDFSVHVWDYRHYPYIDDFKRAKESVSLFSKSDPIKIESKIINPVSGELSAIESVEKTVQTSDSTANTQKINAAVVEHHKVIHVPVKRDEKHRSKKQKPKALMPLTSNALINTKHTLESELRFLVDKTPMPTVLAEPISQLTNGTAKENDEAGSASQTTVVTPEPSQLTDPSLHLAVLGSAEDCARLVKVEREGHVVKGNWEHAMHLTNVLAVGGHDNIDGILREAMKAGEVTESMLLLASRRSTSIYEEALEAYIKQLIQAEDYHKAVFYLLLQDKVDEAIQLLIKKKLYRDAAAISKCILPPELSTTEILDKWIDQTLEEGNFELACKLCCSAGRFDQALSIIEKRNLPYAWKAGIYIAMKNNDGKKAEGLGLKYLEDAMIKGNYDECFQIMTEFDVLKWMMPILLVHQVILEITNLADHKDQEQMITNFKENILKKWTSSGVTDDNEFYLSKIKNLLLLAIPQNIAEAQIIVSKNITLMILDKEGSGKTGLKDNSLQLNQQWIEPVHPSMAKAVASILTEISI